MAQSAAIEEGLKNGSKKSSPAMKERATDAVEKSVEVAKDTAAQASEQAQLAAERANDEFRKLTETGTQFVRENPGAAVAGALGVGILVGLALRGRD